MNDAKDAEKLVTQGDLELWTGSLAFQIEEVRNDVEETRQENNERFDKQDETLERHESILESILGVLQSISGQLAPIKEAPEHIENHEKRITDLEIQVRIGHR